MEHKTCRDSSLGKSDSEPRSRFNFIMRNLKQVSEDHNLTVSGYNKRSSISGRETEHFDPIPVDLVINILSRLPLKCMARCRCVSRLWSSIIRRPNYNLLFPITTLAPPLLLFAFKVAGELFFYSSPQPQNLDVNSSLVATLHHRISDTDVSILSCPVGGLLCRENIINSYMVAVIYNPITGESLTLPKLRLEGMKSERIVGKVSYSLGYDPIEKQFKVLGITWLRCGARNWSEYQVLTIGTGSLLWKKILILHYPQEENSMCINGVLYYPARLNDEKCTIVCFDVRTEKFSFINVDQGMATKIFEPLTFNLIDYKGKLGSCNCDIYHNLFELWVLEDAEEHKWSKHVYQMQMVSPWLNGTSYVRPAGMIASGEIVLYACYKYDRNPFFIFYYNLERNIITRVRLEVSVFEEFSSCRVYTFSNYLEDVTLI